MKNGLPGGDRGRGKPGLRSRVFDRLAELTLWIEGHAC